MSITLKSLIELSKLKVPKASRPKDGFLEIIKKSHHENVISQIYAYFLNPANNANEASIFLEALQELIIDKDGSKAKIPLINYKVITEDYVSNESTRGKIDILIIDEENSSAIIIENKIFHHLNNPLEDYWNNYQFENSNKKGVLLTLENTKIPKEQLNMFVNITHIEWVEKIIELRKNRDYPNNIYITDFCRTIKNLSKKYKMNELTKFYFENSILVNNAIETLNETKNYVHNQMEIIGAQLNLEVTTNGNWRNFKKDKNSKLFYTLSFDGFFDGKHNIYVIIELQDDYIKLAKQIIGNLKRESLKDYKIKDHTNDNFLHLISKEYILKTEHFEVLSNTMIEIINNDFDSIFNEIENEIKYILK